MPIIILTSCYSSYVEITDDYIEINKPGQQFGIVEIVPTKIDTLLVTQQNI